MRGPSEVQFHAIDKVGNENFFSTSFSLDSDTTAPAVDIFTNPGNGEQVNGTKALIITANDLSGIKEIFVTLNSVNLVNEANSSTIFQATIDTLAFSDGLGTFYIKVTDNEGNAKTITTHQWIIDNTPPSLALSFNTVKGLPFFESIAGGYYTIDLHCPGGDYVDIVISPADASGGVIVTEDGCFDRNLKYSFRGSFYLVLSP